MSIIFASKYQAYGNDFFIIGSDAVADSRRASLARDLCHAHFGLGADGCVFLSIQPEKIPFFWIFNRDGSEAGMSGNGARCAAAFLHHKRIAAAAEIPLESGAGRRDFRLLEESGLYWKFRSSMGVPKFLAGEIPFRAGSPRDPVDRYPLLVADRDVSIHALSVGNPQCVVIREELPEEDEFRILGGGLSVHERFPEGTNVSFVRVVDRHSIEIRIWERGVGPTHSSGTGCCGAAVAAIRARLVESPVEVRTSTGFQVVEWSPPGPLFLTGDVCFVADVHYHWPNG